jgi:hypothetical protein
VALAPLATVADLVALGVAVDASEETLVEGYLTAASSAIRNAAGSPISETTSTIAIEGEPEQRLRLPGPPVTAVATVEIDGSAVTDWRLRSGSLWREQGWSPGCTPSEVTVTYTHGLPEVPADITMLVCRIAATTLMAYRSAPDGSGLAAREVQQERIGDYFVTYGDDGGITELELPERTRNRLAARFGNTAALLRSR